MLQDLIELLSPHFETISERRALLRQTLGMRSPLLNQIAYEGSTHEFLVNMLATLARDVESLDVLIDVVKEMLGDDQAQALEALRPTLHEWATSGADLAELDVKKFASSLDIDIQGSVQSGIVNIGGSQDFHGNMYFVHGNLTQGGLGLRIPFMVQPLPPYFVQRPTEFENLVNALVDQNGAVAITAAIRGAGGFGKTTLAMAVCHNTLIKQAFDDGILWVTLGEMPSEADLLKKALDLVVELTGNRPSVESREAARSELANAIGDRYVLLVIDDLWHKADADIFLTGTKNSSVLITTRLDVQLPDQVRFKQTVDAMSLDQAVQLLAWDIKDVIAERHALKALAQRLGEWAMLLRLVNATLRKRIQSGETLSKALNYTDKALTRKGLKAFDSSNPRERTEAVSATLNLSLDLLTRDQQNQFAHLAIFPEDVNIPFTTLEKVWRLDNFETEAVAISLNDAGLLLNFDLNRRAIRLHDVVRQYLIDDHRAELRQWHADFIAALGNLKALPNKYAWQYVAYHLREADQLVLLRSLLLNFDFLQAKLNSTLGHLGDGSYLGDPGEIIGANPNQLLADYELYLALLDDPVIQLISSAINMSAHVLNEDETQLPLQLYGRLQAHHLEPEILAFLSHIKFLPQMLIPLPLTQAFLQPAGGALKRVIIANSALSKVVELRDGRLLSWSGNIEDSSLRIWNKDGIAEAQLKGHTSIIRGALELNDGRLLSWSEDKTLRLWHADGTLEATLIGHKGGLRGALKLRDRRLLSWSNEGDLWLWRADGTPETILKGHKGIVIGALELNDKRLVSWGSDKTLRLWGMDGTPEAQLEGHENFVNGALELRNGQILSWGDDRSLHLWAADGTAKVQLEGHTDSVMGALELNGGQFLSWSKDKTLRLWHADATLKAQLEGHTDSVIGALELRDGCLLSWSEDRSLRLWGADGSAKAQLDGYAEWVKGALELSDGRLLSWGIERSLGVWAADGTAEGRLEGHTGSVHGVLELQHSNKQLLSWGSDNSLRFWDMGRNAKAQLNWHTDSVRGLLQLRDGHLLSWSGDGTLRLWNADGTAQSQLKGHTGSLSGAIELHYGRLLSWSSDDRSLILWGVNRIAEALLRGHSGSVNGALELSDGRLLSWSSDTTLEVWGSDGTPETTLKGHTDVVWGAIELRDGRLLSWSRDNTLRLWHANGIALARLEGHENSVGGTLELRDGRLLSWSTDATLRLWNTDGSAQVTLVGHTKNTGSVSGAIQLRDGRLLSWSTDATLRLWHSDGTPEAQLKGHKGIVRRAMELHDGRILSWSPDGTLRLWGVDGSAEATLVGHRGVVWDALELSDGRLLSWGQDGVLRLWSSLTYQQLTAFYGDAVFLCCVVLENNTIVVGDQHGGVIFLKENK